MSHGDSRTTSSIVGEKTVGPPFRPFEPIGALPPQPKMMRSDSCSAAASMMPSAACRPMRTIGWIGVPFGRVVEHLLEEAAGVPRAGRALGQRHALGDLDDAERRQLAGPRIEHRGTEPDQLLGRARVGDRDQDPRGERRLGTHAGTSTAFQRWTRYGLSSSNSRAWRSTRSSACSVVMCRFSITNEPTRPK